MFYIDHAELKTLPYTQLQSLAVLVGIMTLFAFALLTPSRWYVAVGALVVLIAVASAQNMRRTLATTTVAMQPPGQRHKLILLWSGMVIFYSTMLADTFIIEHNASIAPHRGIATTIGSIIFIGLIYRISWLDRKYRRVAKSEA